MTETRRPLHLPVTMGLSAGLYAVTLAGVTALQAEHDRALAAARDPAAQAFRALQDQDDALARDLTGAGAAFDRAAAGYETVAQRLGMLEQQLGRLAGSVGAARGGAGSLSLPSVGRVRIAAPPAVSATTGASGKP